MKKIYILFSIFFIKKNLNIRNVDHIFLNIGFFSDWYVYHWTRCCNKNYLSFVYNMIITCSFYQIPKRCRTHQKWQKLYSFVLAWMFKHVLAWMNEWIQKLISSTIVHQRENEIFVCFSDVILELPFTLTHPMPDSPSTRTNSYRSSVADDPIIPR